MSQHIIGQMEKRDMRIYVDHISFMTLLKHTVTDGEEDSEDEDIISYELGTIYNLFENTQRSRMNFHAQMSENITNNSELQKTLFFKHNYVGLSEGHLQYPSCCSFYSTLPDKRG